MLSEAEIVAQLAAADAAYRTGATGTAVQDDQDAREDLDDAPHTAETNATFDEILGTEAPGDNVTGKVYDGGNIVTPVNATYFEDMVYDAVQAGTTFDYGSPYTSDYSLASPYVDPLTLIQASLLTGEKFF